MSKKQVQGKSSNAGFFVVLVTAMVVFMGSFALSYKFAIDGGSSNNVIINVDPDQGIPVEIPLGANTETIANLLKDKGLVKSPWLFKMISKLNGYDGSYKSGTHILSKDLEYEDMMKILISNPVSVKVRLKEGSTIVQVADELLAKKLIADKDKFIKMTNTEKFNYKFLEGVPSKDNRLEGYLFPDTYEFGLKADEKEVLKVILDNFNDRFKPDYYDKAKKLGLTVDQVITVASILEKEASNTKERAMIAQVFYNRLNSKTQSLKKLQSCATIQYVFFNRKTGVPAADLQRIAAGKILDKDTAVDDPYNTYKVEGLPPRPICSPSKASIEAALNPDLEAKEYYFFVAKGDGSTVFSRTSAEHEANKRLYQK